MFTACLVERWRFITHCKNRFFCKHGRNEAGIKLIQVKAEIRAVPSERNSYWGAAHCFPSHSVHCYKGNTLKFDNYWGPQPPSPPTPQPPSPPAPSPPGSDRPEGISHQVFVKFLLNVKRLLLTPLGLL